MVLRNIVGIGVIALLVGAASLASAQLPDQENSETSRAWNGPDVAAAAAVVFNLPDGSGSRFTEAVAYHDGDYIQVDATITVTLRDVDRNLIGFPRLSLWLLDNATDANINPCGNPGRLWADYDAVDDIGESEWANPLYAGGHSVGLTNKTQIIAAGVGQIPSASGGIGERVKFNSTDINGDRVVDLLDVIEFTEDFYSGTNPFRSDFVYDGFVDLLDVVILGQTQDRDCP